MKLTAGDGQFANVPEHMAGRYLAKGWVEVKPKPTPRAAEVPAESKPAPRRGRRKVSSDDGVDATE